MDKREHPLRHRRFLICRLRSVAGSRHGSGIGETGVRHESCCPPGASPCAPMSPAECIASAPRLLCGACAEVGSNGAEKPTFGRVPFAGDKRLSGLRIHRDCITRRASPLGHLGHDQRAAVCPDGHVDRVPGPNDLRGFDALAIHADPPTKDGPGRRIPRLEHSCGPEPLVDPHLIHGAMIAGAHGRPADGRRELELAPGLIPWLHIQLPPPAA
jgi:hypothetical protein